MKDSSEEEEVQDVSLHKLLATRASLHSRFIQHAGQRVDKGLLVRLAAYIVKGVGRKPPAGDPMHMVDTDLVESAAYDTAVSCVGGEIMTAGLAAALAARVSGNADVLRAGTPVLSWRGRSVHEWCVGRVRDALPHKTDVKKIPGARVVFDVLSGYPAGETLEQFFLESGVCDMMRKSGMLKKREYRDVHIREAVGMFVMILVAPTDPASISEYMEKPYLVSRNRRLQAARSGGAYCKIKTVQDCLACEQCVYKCPLATHSREYYQRSCEWCGDKGLFDPMADKNKVCEICRLRRWRQQREME